MTDEPELTKLQLLEREAMLLDRGAVLVLVTALRLYRQAVRKAMESRWGDGAIDGAGSSSLEMATKKIEELDW